MEVFIQKMSHVADQIFKQLDNRSLVNCKEVSRSWQKYIEKKNFSWIRIVTIPKVKIGNHSIKHAALHIAAKTGQLKIFEIILENQGDINHMDKQLTPLHLVCANGHFKLVQFLLQRVHKLGVDLDVKFGDLDGGMTAFQMACKNGHSKIAEMLGLKLVDLNIDLNYKTIEGATAFILRVQMVILILYKC